MLFSRFDIVTKVYWEEKCLDSQHSTERVLRRSKIQNTENTNDWEKYTVIGCLSFWWWGYKLIHPLGKHFVSFINLSVPFNLSISTLWYISKRSKSLCPQKHWIQIFFLYSIRDWTKNLHTELHPPLHVLLNFETVSCKVIKFPTLFSNLCLYLPEFWDCRCVPQLQKAGSTKWSSVAVYK